MNEHEIPKPNMTPMIDVVFQLLVFFLVSMKFKTLDMKIEADLPKDVGPSPEIVPRNDPVKLVARLDRPSDGQARVKLDGRILGSTDDAATWQRLETLTAEVRARHLANGGDPDVIQAEVDAAPLVASANVIRAIDTFTGANIVKITFRGTPPPGSRMDAITNESR